LRIEVTRRRQLLFGVVTATLTIVLMIGVLLVADLWAHHRAERTAGVNRRGYRGAIVGAKRSGEWRLVMLGGSTVFGYGVFANESLPAQLESQLRARGVQASVVNLGFNSEGAYAFDPNLRDYAALHPDVVILYEGYNDLLPEHPNTFLGRHGSLVFRATGYFPILPVVLRDKADAVARHGGGSKTVFGAAAGVVDALSRQIGRLSPAEAAAAPRGNHDATGDQPSSVAGERWQFYCGAVATGVRTARDEQASVLVVSQPYISDGHVEQQQALRDALQQFHSDSHVAYVDGGRVVDLKNQHLAFDGMHLTPEGNRIMAGVLASALVQLKPAFTR
jgi:lysophospholipase L1-like esterase